MENEIAGLHLWSVDISYEYERDYRWHSSLWITTDSKSISRATTKARAFLKTSDHVKPVIEGVEYKGTIDS